MPPSICLRAWLCVTLLAAGVLALPQPHIRAASNSPILINEFMPRPSSGPEWAELLNIGPSPVDLSGWVIDDETLGGTRTTIAAGTSIAPHSLLVISLSANILNDTGSDTIQLIGGSGAFTDTHVYTGTSVGLSYARIPDGGDSWGKVSPTPGTSNPQPTALPSPTPSETSAPSSATPTGTALNSPTSTAPITPSATPTSTSLPSSTPSPTPYPAGLVISEFLAYPKTAYNAEWVELYNASSIAIDLSGWKIDDESGGGAPVALPDQTTIAALGYLLIDLPGALLNNDGDSVRLLRPDNSLADSTSYAGSIADISYSRADDGTWYASAVNSPGAPNLPPATPTASPTASPTHAATATRTPTLTPSVTRTIVPIAYAAGVVINEFLAYPKASYANEWVELFNSSTASVELSGWKIDDGPAGGAPYSIPHATRIDAGAYLVIDLPGALLNNDGDSVRLLRPDDSAADTADFVSSSPDASYNRSADGGWYSSGQPSPGAPNLPAPSLPAATPAASAMLGARQTPLPAAKASASAAGAADTPQLSEVLPNPKTRYEAEWVELANASAHPIELSDWAIDDAAAGGSPYRLPAGMLIAPQGLLLIQLPKPLLNNAGDSVRLLRPDGSAADEYQFDAIEADMSVCRIAGVWARCDASPGQPNRPLAAPPAAPLAASSPAPTGVPRGTTITPAPMRPATQPSPTPRIPSWPGATSAAVLYRPRMTAARYRSLVAEPASPTAPAAPTAPIATETPIAAEPDQQPAPATGAAMILLAIGGVVFGYDQLQRRRGNPAECPQQPLDTPEPDA